MNAPAHIVQEEESKQRAARRDCYTQGMDPDGSPNGDFETTWLLGMDKAEALAWVARLPEPRRELEPSAFCPPTFGVVDHGNVCRIEGGGYVSWSPDSDSVDCSFNQALEWIGSAFSE